MCISGVSGGSGGALLSKEITSRVLVELCFVVSVSFVVLVRVPVVAALIGIMISRSGEYGGMGGGVSISKPVCSSLSVLCIILFCEVQLLIIQAFKLICWQI